MMGSKITFERMIEICEHIQEHKQGCGHLSNAAPSSIARGYFDEIERNCDAGSGAWFEIPASQAVGGNDLKLSIHGIDTSNKGAPR